MELAISKLLTFLLLTTSFILIVKCQDREKDETVPWTEASETTTKNETAQSRKASDSESSSSSSESEEEADESSEEDDSLESKSSDLAKGDGGSSGSVTNINFVDGKLTTQQSSNEKQDKKDKKKSKKSKKKKKKKKKKSKKNKKKKKKSKKSRKQSKKSKKKNKKKAKKDKKEGRKVKNAKEKSKGRGFDKMSSTNDSGDGILYTSPEGSGTTARNGPNSNEYLKDIVEPNRNPQKYPSMEVTRQTSESTVIQPGDPIGSQTPSKKKVRSGDSESNEYLKDIVEPNRTPKEDLRKETDQDKKLRKIRRQLSQYAENELYILRLTKILAKKFNN